MSKSGATASLYEQPAAAAACVENLSRSLVRYGLTDARGARRENRRGPADTPPELALPAQGGLSTGPRTPEGLEALRRARTIHGFYSQAVIERRRHARVARQLLADLLGQLRV
jgi:hypothetical protein